MPSPMIPETFGLLLTALQPCFHAPSSANFEVVVAGWVRCLGRRTITAVVLAAGAVGERPVPDDEQGRAAERLDGRVEVSGCQPAGRGRKSPKQYRRTR